MMLGMPVVAERVPVRLFTAANVSSLRLTPAAQASGEWYGSSVLDHVRASLGSEIGQKRPMETSSGLAPVVGEQRLDEV